MKRLISNTAILIPYTTLFRSYVAVAYHKDGYRGSDLTRETYGDIKNGVSAKKFSKLVAGEYRETVFREPASLEQQLPFYSPDRKSTRLNSSHLVISYAVFR